VKEIMTGAPLIPVVTSSSVQTSRPFNRLHLFVLACNQRDIIVAVNALVETFKAESNV